MATYNKDAGVAKPYVAPKPAVRQPAAAPLVYWYEGHAYYSESQYQAAVAASQRAEAAKRAATAAASLQARRRAAKISSYRAAAAAAARQRAELLRRQAVARRDLARRAELQRRSSAQKMAELRRLTGMRKRIQPKDLANQVAMERRASDERLRRARTKAYDNLTIQSRAFLRVNARGVAPIDLPQARSQATPGNTRRVQLVRRAETTGDWQPVLRQLLSESRRSSGRFVDPQLMKEIQAKYVAPIQKVRDEFTQLVAAMQAAEASGDEQKLLELVEDPDNVDLYERFLELFGDGTKPGTFTQTQEMLTEISEARQRSWTGPMAAAGRGEVEQLLKRAQRESQVRQMRPRSARPIDEMYKPLEFVQQVLDPDTGQMKSVRKEGLDAWMAREQAREYERVNELQRQQVGWTRQLGRLGEAEDMELEQVVGGRIVLRDWAVERQAKQVRTWLPQWKLNRDGVPNRIAAAAANPALREQLIREFMRDAEQAYEQNMGQLRMNLRDAAGVRARALTSRANVRGEVVEAGLFSRSWEHSKNAWLAALAQRLGKPGWGELDRFSSTGLGGVAQGALTIFSLFPSLARAALQQGVGTDNQPYLDVRLPVLSQDPGVTWGHSVDPNADKAYADLGASMQGTGGFWESLGAWSSAIRDYSQWGGGNVGGLLTQATDPFMAVGPGRFTRAGSLAMARAGGLAGIREAGLAAGTKGLLAEYARYAGPKALGGAGSEVVRIESAKIALARKLGLPGGEALRLGDDEFRQLIERVAQNRTDELLRSDALKTLTQASGIDKNQLLAMVQAELPDILKQYKIFPESPFDVARRMQAVRVAAVRAQSEAQQAAQLARMQTERQVAMETLSRITGRPLEAPRLTPAALAQHQKLVADYAGSAADYLKVAERGARAADEIEKGLARGGQLRNLQAQLRRAEAEIQRFEDTYRVDPTGRKVLDQRGVVGQYFDRLTQFRGQGDPTAPKFVDQSYKQVRYDERRIKAMIRSTLAQLKATPLGQPLNGQLKARLGELQTARRGLVYERALLDEGRTLMRPYARRHVARIERAVAPQRVAPLAKDAGELATEIGRDFMRQLDGAQVRKMVELTAAQETALAAMRPALGALVDPGAIVGRDFGKVATKALGRQPTLQELWTALRMADRDPLWHIEVGQAVRNLNAEVVRAGRRAGFSFKGMKVRDAADWLWDVLRDDHVRQGGSPVGFADYKTLDTSVENALVAWRDFAAEGQIRLRERRFRPPSGPSEAVFHDNDPYEVLVKMAALEPRGLSVFAYDELRGVLRRPMLREGTAEALLAQAKQRAAREGIDLSEALKIERTERARSEALRNVEEFATRPDLQGLPPETRLRAFEERMLLDDLPQSAGVELSQFQIDSLRQAFEERAGFSFDDKASLAAHFQAGFEDVLGNRSALFNRMQELGHWSPRTGDAIRQGERVWTVDEERRLFESFMGYTPPWTDTDVLKAILNDPRLHEVMLREWGFFDDEYENLAAASGLTPEQVADAVVWGREGFQRQRSLEELRDWAMQRYGDLVTTDGKTLTAMPWLMRADDEYLAWTRHFFDEALGQRPVLQAAREKLPADVRKHLFDGDQLSRAGMEIDPRLVKAAEVRKLRDAIERATRRRIDRMRKAGDIEPGDWLAQEQLRFAYDVTDQLLVDPVWRGILRGKPVLGALLHTWGQFWRMLVSWQPAFPIMNLIESYGFKRLYLTVYEGGMRPLSLDADGRRIVQSLREIGAEAQSTFGLSTAHPWSRVGNRYLSLNERGGALIAGTVQTPLTISAWGENALRLDFARRVAGDTFRTARKTGMSTENAEFLAKAEAKRVVESFFAVGKGRGWETALNELVPFFSYNFKNKTLAVRMLWNHPSTWVWGERIRQQIEDANREQWAKDHPDLPFPEGESNSWLWWKIGDDYYKIDLSSFSDWTRALGNVMDEHTPVEWLTEFLRVPHPSQLGALAMFTGGDTPWGNPGSIRELSFWADLFYWTKGVDYADPRKRRDLIQIMSQMLFFKKWGKIGFMDLKQATFFALRDVDEAAAREYLEANPDLQLYWDSLPPTNKIKGFDPMTRIHYRQLMTEQENRQYDADFEAFDELNDALDAKVERYAAQPWSEEYKLAKREAAIARRAFLNEHPLLVRAWSTFMSPREFAELQERFRVDELADAWFNWKRPQRDAFDSELAYQRAIVDFNERRERFLEANPALEDRLMAGRTAVEVAWKEQELHWTEILDFQARLKIRILEEEMGGAGADRDVIDLLYRVRDLAGAELDADRYGVFEREFKSGRRGSFFAALPGFADFRRDRATPAERKEMDRNEWYAKGIKDIVRRSSSGKEFYDLLRQNPALLQEYWARNPDKKAEFEANQEYIRWIGGWARKLQADDFDGAQAIWDTMPAWVKDRYFAKHPDSKMRDGAGGAGGSAFTDGQGRFFRSADSRDRFLAGQAYFSSISRWVELLKNEEFVKADAYFRSMPDWVKEKYYAKHPDQRAKNELDMAALRYGAEYFLATGDDKLKILAKYPQLRAWLAEHGGDEAAMRGLVQAMYRAIPSGEPWLKRVFREKFPEVFGKQALGERKLRKVAAALAEHPEMAEFYEKAYRLQTALYLEQLKRSKAPPKHWSMERKKRVVKRSKRRAARMNAHWSLHSEIRKQQ